MKKQIYYKAFNRDMTCRGTQFVEGETYELEGTPVLCKFGFHFCRDLVLTLRYYPVERATDNLYAEVEVLGDVVFEEPTQHKGVTNKIRIVRVLSDSEVLRRLDGHDNSGNYNSGDYNSGNINSGDYNSGDYNSGDYNSGNYNSGNYNSGNSNSGNSNSGNGNSGNYNSGDYNSGDYNSGDYNSGNYNSGNSNSGNYNSGDYNSGNINSGDFNSGDYNSGDYNSGKHNSGNYNSGDHNSGHFNDTTPSEILIFGVRTLRAEWDSAYKPVFLEFKRAKGKSYKEDFSKAWDEADKQDRIRIKELPNFNAEVFYNISGIDLREGEK